MSSPDACTDAMNHLANTEVAFGVPARSSEAEWDVHDPADADRAHRPDTSRSRERLLYDMGSLSNSTFRRHESTYRQLGGRRLRPWQITSVRAWASGHQVSLRMAEFASSLRRLNGFLFQAIVAGDSDPLTAARNATRALQLPRQHRMTRATRPRCIGTTRERRPRRRSSRASRRRTSATRAGPDGSEPEPAEGWLHPNPITPADPGRYSRKEGGR